LLDFYCTTAEVIDNQWAGDPPGLKLWRDAFSLPFPALGMAGQVVARSEGEPVKYLHCAMENLHNAIGKSPSLA
jgi:hypothetical protein